MTALRFVGGEPLPVLRGSVGGEPLPDVLRGSDEEAVA